MIHSIPQVAEMVEFFIILAVSFIVMAFFAVVIYLKDRPGKKSNAPLCTCGSQAHPKDGCPRCSGQIQILPHKEMK